MPPTKYFTIVGAGINGLCIARELAIRFPQAKIEILEKEKTIGLHASGRNSGVIHSGIYYAKDSLKARFCKAGGELLKEYCSKNAIPIFESGKLIIPKRRLDFDGFDLLVKRAAENNIPISVLKSHQEITEIEPKANTSLQRAIYVKNTALVNPKQVLSKLERELIDRNVIFKFNVNFLDYKTARNDSFLFNTAGSFADQIAHRFNVAKHLQLLPFKGVYLKLDPKSSARPKIPIYPVPDFRFPFLGVHFTPDLDDNIWIGPNAIPALGRENYRGWNGLSLADSLSIAFALSKSLFFNHDGIRPYAFNEILLLNKTKLWKEASLLINNIKLDHILPSTKVGIRPQLFDKITGKLVQDFVIKKGPKSIHILNAISPAFTCAFSFSSWVVDETQTQF